MDKIGLFSLIWGFSLIPILKSPHTQCLLHIKMVRKKLIFINQMLFSLHSSSLCTLSQHGQRTYWHQLYKSGNLPKPNKNQLETKCSHMLLMSYGCENQIASIEVFFLLLIHIFQKSHWSGRDTYFTYWLIILTTILV